MGLRVNILVDEKKRNNFKKFELVSVRAHMPRQYERRLNTANSATRTGVSQSKHRNEENLWQAGMSIRRANQTHPVFFLTNKLLERMEVF